MAGYFLTLAAILVLATPSFAQAQPENADNVATENAQATEAQSPLTPLFGVLNENYTNFRMGPLHETQNDLIVEPIIPVKLTPDWNLVSRWNTPILSMPQLSPFLGSEFGLSNIQPQFFFTPTHPGSLIWGLGPSLWLPTATDKTLGINRFGGGPVAAALTIQGPLLAGVLAQNIWAGSTGTSQTLQRVNTLTVEPFVFYNLPGGWYLTSRPIITSDWTINAHNRWTVPLGGGFGRVFPVGNMVMELTAQGFYNGITPPAAGITNVGRWTAQVVVHFLWPEAPVASLY